MACFRIACLCLTVGSVGMGFGPMALAQADGSSVEAARQLFSLGLTASNEGRWGDAVSYFSRSYALAPRPSTLLNLAQAQKESGHWVDSIQSYRRFLSLVDKGPLVQRRAEAEQSIADLEAKVGRLTVHISGIHDQDRVWLGEMELAHEALGVIFSVDPGSTTVRVERGGGELVQRLISVEEGAEQEVFLEVPLVVADETSYEASDETLERSEWYRKPWVWVGAGAVIVGVVATVLWVSRSKDDGPHKGTLGGGTVVFELSDIAGVNTGGVR